MNSRVVSTNKPGFGRRMLETVQALLHMIAHARHNRHIAHITGYMAKSVSVSVSVSIKSSVVLKCK